MGATLKSGRLSSVPRKDPRGRRRAGSGRLATALELKYLHLHAQLVADNKPMSGRAGGYVYYWAYGRLCWRRYVVPKDPAHGDAAILPDRFRCRFQGLERIPGADGRTAGCLVRPVSKAYNPPPSGAVGAAYRPTTLRRTKRGQGAVGLGLAVGATRGGKGEGRMQNAESRICPASPAAAESCATLLGYSPGMRRTCAVPAPRSQGVCKGGYRHILPLASAVPSAPYATLLGPPPYRLQTPSGAMPVPGAVSPSRRQHLVAPTVVHHCPNPPSRRLPGTLAWRLARLLPSCRNPPCVTGLVRSSTNYGWAFAL
jgi:hypothetical protein